MSEVFAQYAAWLNASQRIRVGARMNRYVKCKVLLAV